MSTPVILTLQQEADILEGLSEWECDAHGAARIVFLNCRDIVVNAGVQIPNGVQVVVKVSIGIGGMNQTVRETRVYLESIRGDYDDKPLPLARLFAYGRIIEVMEQVEHYDYDWLLDEWEPEDGDKGFGYHGVEFQTEADKQLFFDAYYAFERLNDCFGYTSDNTQMGIDHNGHPVCYDWGYLSHAGYKQCSHDVCDEVSEYRCAEYLTECAGYLRLIEENNLLVESMDEFFNDMENAYQYHRDEDEYEDDYTEESGE